MSRNTKFQGTEFIGRLRPEQFPTISYGYAQPNTLLFGAIAINDAKKFGRVPAFSDVEGAGLKSAVDVFQVKCMKQEGLSADMIESNLGQLGVASAVSQLAAYAKGGYEMITIAKQRPRIGDDGKVGLEDDANSLKSAFGYLIYVGALTRWSVEAVLPSYADALEDPEIVKSIESLRQLDGCAPVENIAVKGEVTQEMRQEVLEKLNLVRRIEGYKGR